MKNCKEEDLYLLKEVSMDRLHPARITIFMFGMFLFTSIIIITSTLGFDSNVFIQYPVFSVIYMVLLFLLGFQFLLFLPFLSAKFAFKFERLQIMIFSFIIIKFSLELYFIYFLDLADTNANIYLYYLGFIFMIIGLFIIIIGTRRGINKYLMSLFLIQTHLYTCFSVSSSNIVYQ